MSAPFRKPFYIITISGIPQAFADCAYSGALGGVTYTYYPLLLSNRLRLTGDSWDLRGGKGNPGVATFEIMNRNNLLSTLLATQLSTAARTYLMEEKAYSSAVGETIYCYDHSAFPAAGILYWGLETSIYTGKTNAGGGVPYDRFDGVSRGAYGSMGYRHTIYDTADPGYQSNPILSTTPYIWTGRYVTVWQGTYNQAGSMEGVAVLWRGILTDWAPSDDGEIYSFSARSLLGILDRTVGEQAGTAEVLQIPSGTDGHQDLDLFYYIDDLDNATLEIYWSDGTTTTAPLASGIYDSLSSLGWHATGAHGYGIVYDARYAGRICLCNWDTAVDIRDWYIGPDSLARALGFDAAYGGQAIAATGVYCAPNEPSLVFFSERASRIYIQNSTLNIPVNDPNSIFASNAIELCIKNRDYDVKEICRCSPVLNDGLRDYIDIYRRGGGTDDHIARAYAIWSESPDPIAIRQVILSDYVPPAQFLKYLLTSCDGTGFNGNWDVLPPGWGAELPVAWLDDSLTYADAFAGPPSEDAWLVDESISLWDLFKSIFQISGCQLVVRSGVLGMAKIGECSAALSTSTITDAAIVRGSPLRVSQDASLLLNRIKINSNYSIQSGSYLRNDIDVGYDASAISMACGVGLMTIEARGKWFPSSESMTVFLATLMSDMATRYGLTPTTVGPLEVQGWLSDGIWQGDSVLLTSEVLQSPVLGTRGLSAHPAYVLKCEIDVPKGSRKLTLILSSSWNKRGAYAPAGIVVSYNAGTGALVIEADAMTWPASNDIGHFTADMRIMIYRQKTEQWTCAQTVLSVVEATDTLMISPGALLTDGNPPAAGDRVRFSPWSMPIIALQQRYSYIVDYTTKLLNGVDTPFEWS